jgi:hypothetical protein
MMEHPEEKKGWGWGRNRFPISGTTQVDRLIRYSV